MTTTTAVPAATADIVRHCQTLPNGYMILECRRFLANMYDLEQKAWIKSMVTNMKVTTSQQSMTGSLVKALGTQYFYYDVQTGSKKKNKKDASDGREKEDSTVEIVQIKTLPPNYVATSATVPPMIVLKVGDILVCAPPTTTSFVSSAPQVPSPPPQQDRWKIDTLQSVVEARDKAIKEGRSSYLMYFAQPPAPNHHAVAKTTTTIATASSCPKYPSIACPPFAGVATGATDDDGPATTTTALRVNNNNNISKKIPIGVSHEKTAAPTVQMKHNYRQTTTNRNPKPAVAVATMPSPNDVPSAEMVPSSAHLVTAATWATTKRKATVGEGNGKKKLKTKKRHRSEKGESVASVTPAITAAGTIRTAELPTDVFDKMPPKQRQHTLYQQALAKYDAAKKFVDVFQSMTAPANVAGDPHDVGYAALHAALGNYVPPPVPALVTPPTSAAATGDIAFMFQQVGDYTVALLERNKEFERYMAAWDQWKLRVEGAVQDWSARAEVRRQDGQARIAAHGVLVELQQAIAVATAALRRAEEKEAESVQAEKPALQALLACFDATAGTE